MNIKGIIAAWGVRDLGYIEGVPIMAKAKVRMRNTEFARIYILKDGTTTEHCILGRTINGPWYVGDEMARNQTTEFPHRCQAYSWHAD